jgi:hypothetical protein
VHGFLHLTLDIWFHTEADCKAFIAGELVGCGLLPDE